MSRYFIPGFVFIALLLTGCTLSGPPDSKTGDNIVIENPELRLVITRDGKALSLVHKPSGQECLYPDLELPVFTLTQYRPYDNELQLAYPAITKTFTPDTVCWKDGDLVVCFRPERNKAIIGVKITDYYIGFTLKRFEYDYNDLRSKRKTEVDEFTLLQLPVRERTNFGEWLNVTWDSIVAVNLLATDPYAKIDARERSGYRIFKAGTDAGVKTEGVGAALITTATENLLDRVDRVERDFHLPKGVESRRSKEYRYSYYEACNVTPQNIDRHIAFAQKGGFRAMQIVWSSFACSIGHFPWRADYPGGMKDLQTVIRKIHQAGMLAGAHFWYNKAEKTDPYVTPVPDYRLNLSRTFTLAASLDQKSDTVVVEENPEGCTLDNDRRILKIGNELIEYDGYTANRPYRFTGCKRGVLNTHPSKYGQGFRFGLLDVDTWTIWVRFDQRTSIPQEMAERIGAIYNEAGFDFVYFDGAEDIHPPYWFYTSMAQLKVYNCLEKKPVFSEGALKSHFSWHILTRGNAFDIFSPEVMKEATRRHPLAEVGLVSNDFTSINFGWIGYTLPGENTTGIQPDMLEYVCSRAAAWDCPVSLTGDLDQLQAHPRTTDNLEAIRRWEEARLSNFFSEKQKQAMRDPAQEFTLLINEQGKFELHACKQIENIAGGDSRIRAFVFDRKGKECVVYWHTSGEGRLALNLDAGKVHLYKGSGEEITTTSTNDGIVIPVGGKYYLETEPGRKEIITAFREAKIL